MKKKLQLAMLLMIIGTQTSNLALNLSLYASEIESEASEVTSEATVVTEDTSEVISEEIVETTEINSEQVASIQIVDASVAYAKASRSTKSTLKEDENQTSYVNQDRIDMKSGTSKINITPNQKAMRSDLSVTDKEVYYVLNDDAQIISGSTKQPRSYSGNLLTVYNGEVVEADNAIARTSGGYEYSFYIYETLDDLKSNTDGIPLSGGGFDASYLETIKEDGKYYYRVKISGYEGYVAAENIQIVPEELIKSRSYYVAEDGDWVYYSAMDPLASDQYERMELSEAPATAKTGVKYYSDDDLNYSTDQLIDKNTKAAISYNSYFMNLPFRSSSSYTASDYKSYLKAQGKTSSVYYNETSAFSDAQTKEDVNSLMIFAMANHESAYGLSKYAKACYNFFGRGAIDSDPDRACQYYGYNTATDGILSQTLFLQNGYFDTLDWRYSGTHAGNKQSGMNVKYASDVNWGKLISNHAYLADQYLGGKDQDRHSIIQVTGKSLVYTTSSRSTRVKSSGDNGSYSSYDIAQNVGDSNTVNVVARQQLNGSYQIYVPTSVKRTSSADCSYTNSMRGSYPNYGGRKKISVATNTANYSCDYGGLNNGLYWISQSNTKLISNKEVPLAASGSVINEYDKNGNLAYQFIVDEKTKVIKYAYRFDTSGNIINKYTYYPNTVYGDRHAQKKRAMYYVKNGKVYLAKSFNSSNQVQYIYNYYSSATLSTTSSNIKTRFNLDPATGHIKNAYGYEQGTGKRVKLYRYRSGTTYSTRSTGIQYRFDFRAGTSYITRMYRFNTLGNVDRVYIYQPNTIYGQKHYNHYRYIFYLKGDNMELTHAYGYNTDNKRVIKYTYRPGTIYGQGHGSRISSRYYY